MTRRFRHAAARSAIEFLEKRQLLSSALVLTPASGNNTFYIKEDPNQLDIDIWQNSATPGSGTPTDSVLISQTTSITAEGGSGNDTLIQAGALPIPIYFAGGTYQGYSNTSTWSRGEAWAIYGFAQCYADTGRADFLATSESAANWFISHLPSDDVPYWDFDAPVTPTTYRDTSAAAVAASGLLQLSALISKTDPTNSAKYRNAAASILASLASSAYLSNPMTADNGTLTQGALNVPADPSINDNPIYFGDYYFVEAINEYLG